MVTHPDADLVAVNGWEYIGCYVDTDVGRDPPGGRDLVIGGPSLTGTNAERALQCATGCAGYRYMAMQWTAECWCDNDYGAYGMRTIDNCDTDSSVDHYPDVADRAGTDNGPAGWTNSVYEITYLNPSGNNAGALSSVSNIRDTLDER